jgi:hypothetical protein
MRIFSFHVVFVVVNREYTYVGGKAVTNVNTVCVINEAVVRSRCTD